jgi:hypothetical protein
VKRSYASTEDYIRGEYGGELDSMRVVLHRHGVWDDALLMDVVGYYTGCLDQNGKARVSRRTKAPVNRSEGSCGVGYE